MSISGIEGFVPSFPAALGGAGTTGVGTPATGLGGGPLGGVGATTEASRARGADFGAMVLDGIDRLEGLQDRTDRLAVQAATGDLSNIHDYTMAATETAVTTQLTVAVRNKALESFNEIMRMHVG